jgi:hypothetical protein
MRAKYRGVGVKLIADRTTPCERASGIDPFDYSRACCQVLGVHKDLALGAVNRIDREGQAVSFGEEQTATAAPDVTAATGKAGERTPNASDRAAVNTRRDTSTQGESLFSGHPMV